ncbi:hypothetical protein [Exiguobacterium algae]|uniref:hypothetical protein n=1 Tax=Exiguobacterium algae TaxID=2751250 RepID=UPI001BEC34D0|nr:hypothetical protein [Exiguobacterium algae]
MKYMYSACLVLLLLFVGSPSIAKAATEPIVVHENIVVEEEVEIYEGFRSPNEMVYIFVLIVFLSVIGLGIINSIE